MLIHLLIVLLLDVASTTKTPSGAQGLPRLRGCFAAPMCPCRQSSRLPIDLPVGPWSPPRLRVLARPAPCTRRPGSASSPRVSCRGACGDLLSFLSRLRQSDRDGLLATLHFAPFTAFAAPQSAAFPSTHRAFNLLARAPAVLPLARFLLHLSSSPWLVQRHSFHIVLHPHCGQGAGGASARTASSGSGIRLGAALSAGTALSALPALPTLPSAVAGISALHLGQFMRRHLLFRLISFP